MDLIVFESEAYYKMQAYQMELFKKALVEAKLEAAKQLLPENDFLTIDEAMKVLPYRSKTKWQELRDSGEIVFSQFGRKIKYSRKSLLHYIEKKKVKSRF